jgi:hypothetical protein
VRLHRHEEQNPKELDCNGYLAFWSSFAPPETERALRNISINFTKVNKSGTIVYIGMSRKSLKPHFCKH